MFGISFSELIVITVVALLVIGPEKLPKVARTIGTLVGRIQRYTAQVKEEVNREFRFEELQKLQEEIKQSVSNAEQSMQQKMAELESTVAEFSDENFGYESNQQETPKPVKPRKPRTKSLKADAVPLKKNAPEKSVKKPRSTVKKVES